MKLTVVAFASAREALGSSELVLELEAGSDLDALRRELSAKHPDLAGQWERIAVAVDGQLTRDNPVLRGDQEIALLPPVSGG